MKTWGIFVLTFVAVVGGAAAGSSKDAVEKKVDAVMAKMTFEEKARLCIGGSGGMMFAGVPRLGIASMHCTDGPRGPHKGGTAFPSGPGQSATWNPALMEQMGVVIGKETRAENATVLLGPAFNILRDPLGGRFFEYYSEDPYLNGALVAPVVKGIQSQNVAACLKHFVCNNRENNRGKYMSHVDERTLREIYLPAFRMGVEAGAWTVMTGANGVNGFLLSDNRYLLTDILKEEWGFDGFVMTDWCGTRSTELAANAGLDVSMPWKNTTRYATHLFGQPLLDAVKAGRVPAETVEDKARRVLRVAARTGVLDGVPQTEGGERGCAQHHQVARQMAEESAVLLKNEGLLPLDRTALKKLLVVGPNADKRFCRVGLGGSSWVLAENEVSALQGIREAAGPGVEVETYSIDKLMGFRPITAADLVQEKNHRRGFRAEYRKKHGGAPIYTDVVDQIDFMWEMRSPDVDRLGMDHFMVSYTARINPPVTGLYTLRIQADDFARLGYLTNGLGAPLAVVDTENPEALSTVFMTKGHPFQIRVDYREVTGDAHCRLSWALPVSDKKMETEALVRLAQSVDAVVFVGGLDHGQDTEGTDRRTMEFPAPQVSVIQTLAAANPNFAVVLINGSPLELGKWIDQVPAVLESWYNGESAGAVIGDILFGRVNPSGRLPFTWPNTSAETPAHAVGTQTHDEVNYKEGLFVGYRYYDQEEIKPQFPFGFGLGYAPFEYQKLTVAPSSNRAYPATASVTLKNTGKVVGKEVVQVYVSDLESRVEQPVKELAGFVKVKLNPGEVKTVQVPLFWAAFQYYDVSQTSWVFEAGNFVIRAGHNACDLPLNCRINLKGEG